MARRATIAAIVTMAALLTIPVAAGAAPDRVVGAALVTKGSIGTDVTTGLPIPNGTWFVAVNALGAPGRPGSGRVWFAFTDFFGLGPLLVSGVADAQCVSVYEDEAGDRWARVEAKLRVPLNLPGMHFDYVNLEVNDLGPNPSAPDPYFRSDRWYATFFEGTAVFNPADECRVDQAASQLGPSSAGFEDVPTVLGNFFLVDGF